MGSSGSTRVDRMAAAAAGLSCMQQPKAVLSRKTQGDTHMHYSKHAAVL